MSRDIQNTRKGHHIAMSRTDALNELDLYFVKEITRDLKIGVNGKRQTADKLCVLSTLS